MVAEFEKIELPGNTGFLASYLDEKGGIWHYHPEYELVLNLKSYGTRIIGDNVELFDSYDMTFIAGNIPHSWNHYRKDGGIPPRHGIVLQFSRTSLGEDLLRQPEMNSMNHLFELALRGIAFPETVARAAEPWLDLLTRSVGLEKMAAFFSLMNILCSTEKKRLLCSESYRPSADQRGSMRMNGVYDYIRRNYSKPITLNDAALVAKMNPQTFSRLFRKNSGAGLIEYINQVRSNRACYLLRETDKHVYEIAIECGFQSISNFNTQFRKFNSLSPVEYRDQFR